MGFAYHGASIACQRYRFSWPSIFFLFVLQMYLHAPFRDDVFVDNVEEGGEAVIPKAEYQERSLEDCCTPNGSTVNETFLLWMRFSSFTCNCQMT